jgi:hypothetical protein
MYRIVRDGIRDALGANSPTNSVTALSQTISPPASASQRVSVENQFPRYGKMEIQ